ncbi:hypothetical protein [Klebsiella phage 05F01]|nr:hypothetical protein [Klebsiella phage 05F01]
MLESGSFQTITFCEIKERKGLFYSESECILYSLK